MNSNKETGFDKRFENSEKNQRPMEKRWLSSVFNPVISNSEIDRLGVDWLVYDGVDWHSIAARCRYFQCARFFNTDLALRSTEHFKFKNGDLFSEYYFYYLMNDEKTEIIKWKLIDLRVLLNYSILNDFKNVAKIINDTRERYFYPYSYNKDCIIAEG